MVDERGFAMVDVGDDADIPKFIGAEGAIRGGHSRRTLP
jgi:hypothetical protein